MKYFAVFAVLLCLAAAVRSDDMKVGSSYGGGAPAGGYGGASAGGYGGASAGGYGGAPSGGYGGASIPAPPCPKNYLFSCQPNLQPAPCAQSSGGYGSAGAYSENYPTYAVPQYAQGYQGY